MIRIGSHIIPGKVLLAPMAGITDLPFRTLCRQFGAGLACSEMLTSDVELWHTDKSSRRLPSDSEDGFKVVQIAGTEPEQLAAAAALCEQLGADIIDINMGCPAKKVCKKLAGSALMQNEILVADILQAVVSAVNIPVTLKIRTGWDTQHRNGPSIAMIAEEAGIQALAVHGRTRACRFVGDAEYDTIAEIVQRVNIPVLANGDITTPLKAERVLAYTGAAGIMIGRGAFGKPWLFAEINRHLGTNSGLDSSADKTSLAALIDTHLDAMHRHYGERAGVRIARKHMAWYLQGIPESRLPVSVAEAWRNQFNGLETAIAQRGFVAAHQDILNYPVLQNNAIKPDAIQSAIQSRARQNGLMPDLVSTQSNSHFTDQAA